MGLPIIGDVLNLIDKGLDKIFPDKNVKIQTDADLQKFKEQLKAQLKAQLLEDAMTEKKLLFQDTASARDVFMTELKAQNTPKWARAIQVLGRQFALYSTIALYVYSKISTQFGFPPITLNARDYYLIGTVFVFLFGARSIEKILNKD